MKAAEIVLGMVFTFGSRLDLEYVAVELYEDGVMMERITCRTEGSNRHKSGYGHFKHPLTNYIRTMDEKELSCYQTKDPVCSLEKGIYKAKNNIDTLLEQPAIEEDEVLLIIEVNWDDYHSCQGEHYKLNVIYQQLSQKGCSGIGTG